MDKIKKVKLYQRMLLGVILGLVIILLVFSGIEIPLIFPTDQETYNPENIRILNWIFIIILAITLTFGIITYILGRKISEKIKMEEDHEDSAT